MIFFLASCLDSGKATEKSKQKNKNPDPRLPVGVLLTVATRNDVIFYSVDINTRALGCFSVLPRENNGTDRDTLSLDIVNFREVIFFHDGSFVSRDVRLLDSFISGFRAFTVEFSSGSRRGARGRGARKSLIFRPK